MNGISSILGLLLVLVPPVSVPPKQGTPIDQTRYVVDAIQQCRAEKRQTCRLPWGTYYVRPANVRLSGDYGGMVIDLTSVVLRALPSVQPGSPHIDGQAYYVLGCIGCRNVTIRNGRLVGERRATPPEQWSADRHLIFVQGAENVVIDGTVLEDTEGDGLCEFPIMRNGVRTPTYRLTVRNVRTNRVGRNGVSILSARCRPDDVACGGRGFVIQGCEFRNTYGKPPQGGVCIEPERGDCPEGVIEHVTCENNRGSCVDLSLQHSTDLDPGGTILVNHVTSRGDGSGIRLGGSAHPRGRPYATYRVSFNDIFVEKAKWSGVVIGLPGVTYDAPHSVYLASVLLRDCAANWLWYLEPGWVPTPITVDASCGWTGQAEFPK